MDKWIRAKYQPNLPLYEGKRVTASKEHILLSKEAAKEGMVLLKNDDGVLPLKKGTRIALIGKGTFDYVKGGGGSGDVYCPYMHNIYDGFKALPEYVKIYEPLADFYKKDVEAQYAKGAEPGMTLEPEVPEELFKKAAVFADTAIISISRFSGEGWDRSDIEYTVEGSPWPAGDESMPKKSGRIFPKGDFFLNDNEEKMVKRTLECFRNVIVVINAGGMTDTSFIKNDERIKAALLAWQGGMEGGSAAAELLVGISNPSGKLTDTFATSLSDYPSTEGFHESFSYVEYTEDIYVGYRYFETVPGARDKVVYPFGYGLSYTDFDIEYKDGIRTLDGIKVAATVTNTGKVAGKEVVQLYLGAPKGQLGKAQRSLIAFGKTKLLAPGESCTVFLEADDYAMSSYDDMGAVKKSSYVLEKGEYRFFLGNSVEDASEIPFGFKEAEDKIVRKLKPELVPTTLHKRMLSDGSYHTLDVREPYDPDECAFEKIPEGSADAMAPGVRELKSKQLFSPYKDGVKTIDKVLDGEIDVDAFVSQMTDEELIELLCGHANTGVANTFGFGDLPEYGVPCVMTADGPAGVRIQPETGIRATAFPCATLLAATWNPDIVEEVGRSGAEEVKENNLSVWLTPAVNIHRNPMCGRNFEYYSEDPLLAGKTGAAMVRGIQSVNVAASVKHFAANNKETNRRGSDSRVSERALREIYLKVFEIIVKEADPWTIMTSYNIINGRRSSESHELLEDILRGEWGFKGMVTTDWWNLAEQYKEILAGNDVKMGCGYPERVKKALDMGLIKREDLIRCSRRVIELLLKLD